MSWRSQLTSLSWVQSTFNPAATFWLVKALKGTWKRPSSAPLSFLPYTLVSLPAYSKDDGYLRGRAGDVMGLLYSWWCVSQKTFHLSSALKHWVWRVYSRPVFLFNMFRPGIFNIYGPWDSRVYLSLTRGPTCLLSPSFQDAGRHHPQDAWIQKCQG